MAMVCKALVLIIFPIQFPTEQPNTLPSFSYLLSYVGMIITPSFIKARKLVIWTSFYLSAFSSLFSCSLFLHMGAS